MSTEIKCPQCGSKQLSANPKGFSGKKAFAGVLLTGGIGLLAGLHGKDDIVITCLACGHQFEPGDSKSTSTGPREFNEPALDRAIKEMLATKGRLAAINYCKTMTGWNDTKVIQKVDDTIRTNNITVAKGTGCASLFIVAFILLSATTAAILIKV